MTSTPRSWSFIAIRTFSRRFIEQPGDCSPSRKVVSKMLTLFCGMEEDATEGWAKSQSYNLYGKINSFNYPRHLRSFTWHFRDAAGVFLELAGVVEAGQMFLKLRIANPRADLAEDLF